MEHDIFISYSRKDGNFVKFIEAELQRRGITYFIDKRNIKLSQDYADEIAKAIKACRMTVFLWSENSNLSEHATNEITLAFNLRKPIVTLKVGRFEPAGGLIYRLSKYNYAEIETFRPEAVREMGEEIADLLSQATGQSVPPPPEPVQYTPASGHTHPADRVLTEGLSLFEEREYARAVELLAEPAKQGNPQAQETLCLIFRNYSHYAELLPDDYLQFREEAEAGKPYAQFILARMYKTEFDRQPADFEQAFAWSMRAAEQGFRYAQFLTGNCYHNGLGTKCDYPAALDWYQRAAAQGDTYAMGDLAQMYEKGRGVQKDMKKAVEWYRKGEALNDTTCVGNLGVLYLNGSAQPALEHDTARGEEYLLRAAGLGDAWYLGYLGNAYEQGFGGLQPDKEKSRDYLEQAAEAGEISAKYRIATIYYSDGEDDLAFAWCQKAAELKDKIALYLLGHFYQHGVGCKPDMQQAWESYSRAAALGDTDAPFRLGELCETGQAPEGHDRTECVHWYTLAGEGGMLNAQQKLCEIYSEGILAAKDEQQLFKWVKKAAENGDLNAQRRLARFYLEGIGAASPRMKVLNETKGLTWYRRAAESGDLMAQLELARMYENGVVGIICRNETKAHGWYLKAAGNNSAEAQFKVGRKLYDDNKLKEARTWLIRALDQGWNEAKKTLFCLDHLRDLRQDLIRLAEDCSDDFVDAIPPGCKPPRLAYGNECDNRRLTDMLFLPGIGYEQKEGKWVEETLRQLYASAGEEERLMHQPKDMSRLMSHRNYLVSSLNTLAARFNAVPVAFRPLPIEELTPVYTDRVYDQLKRETANAWLFLKRYFPGPLEGVYFYDDEKVIDLSETVQDPELEDALISITNICLTIELAEQEMYFLCVDMDNAAFSNRDDDFRSIADRLYDGTDYLMAHPKAAGEWYARIGCPTDRDRERLELFRAEPEAGPQNDNEPSETAE